MEFKRGASGVGGVDRLTMDYPAGTFASHRCQVALTPVTIPTPTGLTLSNLT